MKVRYLDRWLIQGPYIGMCLDAAGFYAELKRLEVPKRPEAPARFVSAVWWMMQGEKR